MLPHFIHLKCIYLCFSFAPKVIYCPNLFKWTANIVILDIHNWVEVTPYLSVTHIHTHTLITYYIFSTIVRKEMFMYSICNSTMRKILKYFL